MRPLPLEKESFLEGLWKKNKEKVNKQQEGKGKEQMELTFQGGQFAINLLSHYAKEERRPYMFPFVNLFVEDSHKDMKLDIIKRTLQSAIMTTYGFEEQLLEPLAKANINLVVVNDAGKDAKHTVILKNHQEYSNWTLILPEKQNSGQYAGAFHPKIWILKFPHFLRILIGSPNLHIGDWTMWSQAFWVQDFPKAAPVFQLDQKSQEFKDMVIQFMGQILPKEHNCERLLQINFEDYDFSGVKIRLVQSMPGRISQDDLKLYGLGRLSDIISQQLKANNLKPIDKMVITYQTTSIGMIDEKYLQYLKQAFRGETLHEIQNEDKNKKIDKMFVKKNKKDEKKQVEKDEKKQVEKDEQEETTVQLKLVYPSFKYIVNQTQGGPEWANPLFMKQEHYEKSKVIRESLHKFEGNDNYLWNAGLIPHLKTIIVTGPDMVIDDSSIIYFGSHNFSYSAWGRVEKNATQLSISNTELGILLPPELGSKKDKEDIVLNRLPFKFPPTKYNEGELPWIKEIYEQNPLREKNIK